MVEAFVTPKLITWARQRNNLTSEAAARKISVSPETFDGWEKGRARPTLRQAQVLAHRLYVPFGYLFLSDSPNEELPLPDLRRVAGVPPPPPSPEFADLLGDVLRKQEWYRERQEAEGAPPIGFVGRFGLRASVETVAADIRDTVGVNEDLRQGVATWEQFLTEFIRRVEGIGVLVLRSGIVGSNTRRTLDIKEFRGFAISDDLAPVVFINSRDAKTAQIFTLAHELAHIWIGQSGVSNPDYFRRTSEQENAVDRFCDQVAAETLTPKEDFLSQWRARTPIDQNVRALVGRFRVSRFVILRRAYDLNLIVYGDYQAYFRAFLEDQRPKGEEGGGNFYTNLLARNSRTFTFALLVSAAEGRIPYKEAAQLLNLKIKTLVGIQDRLLRSPATNA